MTYFELLPWGPIKSPYTGETIWNDGLLNPQHVDGYWINWGLEPVTANPRCLELLNQTNPKSLKSFLLEHLQDIPNQYLVTLCDPESNIHLLLCRNPKKAK